MTSIIKNQLVKHLSKFTRNLKPSDISLDVLKGKSKLQNIEINEQVLTELLELPSWLRIRRAYCTGVTVSVPWTRLKSAPVQIFIDEINVDVELSSGAPPPKGSSSALSSLANDGYGFVEKIVEGMSVYINCVEINFDSDAFGGSLMLQRLSVESRTPAWMQPADLRQSRISCHQTNRVLIYKQISWHLLRIEASSKSNKSEKRSKINAPLRLITSGGKIRVALKKNSIDGTVIFARIQTILEDILWVATLPQLRSAISFYSYIMELVREAQKNQPLTLPLPSSNKPASLSVPDKSEQSISSSSIFRNFDFDQTSHHLHVKKIDLHLCDDANANSGYPPDWDIDSGAMQVTIYQLLIDIYPHTLISSDRSSWLRYTSPNAFTQWMDMRTVQQYSKLQKNAKDETVRARLTRCWPQIISFNVVVRIFDLTVQCVSDMSSKKDTLKNMFVSERQARSLPSDQYIVHFEFANHYHPMSDTLEAPSPCSYLQLGPFSLLFDERTLRWIIYVVENLTSAVEDCDLPEMPKVETPDIRVDLLMPKIIIPLPPADDIRLPSRLVLSMSTLSLSNCPFETSAPPTFNGISDYLLKTILSEDLLHGREILMDDLYSAKRADERDVHGAERFWFRTSPVWIDTDYGHLTKELPVVSDVSFTGQLTIRPDIVTVYVEAMNDFSLVVDHFQFLQLTRFLTKLSDCLELISRDQDHYLGAKPSKTPTVAVVAAIGQVDAHILLSRGQLPSPYDMCPTLNEPPSFSLLSESSAVPTPRSNTPKRVPSAASTNPCPPASTTTNAATKHSNIAAEEFPEFPRPPNGGEIDTISVVDDAVSIATSLEDESFDFELNADDDPFGGAEMAEEATFIDEVIINDRIYKSLMAKNINVLSARLKSIHATVNLHKQNARVLGGVNTANLSFKLNILRNEIYDAIRKMVRNTSPMEGDHEQVKFSVNVPANSRTSFVNVEVVKLRAELDDEIVTHLSPFLYDEQVTENRVRLTVAVNDSDISIKDRKNVQPLRVRIKECVIEQSEDHPEDNLKTASK